MEHFEWLRRNQIVFYYFFHFFIFNILFLFFYSILSLAVLVYLLHHEFFFFFPFRKANLSLYKRRFSSAIINIKKVCQWDPCEAHISSRMPMSSVVSGWLPPKTILKYLKIPMGDLKSISIKSENERIYCWAVLIAFLASTILKYFSVFKGKDFVYWQYKSRLKSPTQARDKSKTCTQFSTKARGKSYSHPQLFTKAKGNSYSRPQYPTKARANIYSRPQFHKSQ